MSNYKIPTLEEILATIAECELPVEPFSQLRTYGGTSSDTLQKSTTSQQSGPADAHNAPQNIYAAPTLCSKTIALGAGSPSSTMTGSPSVTTSYSSTTSTRKGRRQGSNDSRRVHARPKTLTDELRKATLKRVATTHGPAQEAELTNVTYVNNISSSISSAMTSSVCIANSELIDMHVYVPPQTHPLEYSEANVNREDHFLNLLDYILPPSISGINLVEFIFIKKYGKRILELEIGEYVLHAYCYLVRSISTQLTSDMYPPPRTVTDWAKIAKLTLDRISFA